MIGVWEIGVKGKFDRVIGVSEIEMKTNEDQDRFLFGISLSHRPAWQQFLICSSGFFFGYLVNGICEVLFFFSSLPFVYIFAYFMFMSLINHMHHIFSSLGPRGWCVELWSCSN